MRVQVSSALTDIKAIVKVKFEFSSDAHDYQSSIG